LDLGRTGPRGIRPLVENEGIFDVALAHLEPSMRHRSASENGQLRKVREST